MDIKTIASAAALSVALGFSGFVYAQEAAALPTSIGEQQLTEADAQRVKVYCDDLQTAANQAVAGSEAQIEVDPATDESEQSDGSEQVGSVDMNLITVEACLDAGFITAP